MAWKKSFLVIANVTAGSAEVLDALHACTTTGPAQFTLIVPASNAQGGFAAATGNLERALERMRDAGLDVVGGHLGDSDPLVAVSEAWDPRRYDEIIVSTLPMGMSKWLHAGLPERIGRLTGAPVTHLVSEPPRPVVRSVSAPASGRHVGVMSALYPLEWGRSGSARAHGSRGGAPPEPA